MICASQINNKKHSDLVKLAFGLCDIETVPTEIKHKHSANAQTSGGKCKIICIV